MHELEITKHILEDSIQEAKRYQAVRIREIHLTIGPFSGIVPACVQMYIEVLAKGTIAEGVQIRSRMIPLQIKCLDCGKTSEIDRMHIECPYCHSLHLKRLSGKECLIERLEVDVDGDQSISSSHGME